jgi:biopolymer transport protein ExbD
MAAKLSGPGGGSRFVVEQNHDINVTPFVDVMLVLLIIFMVAAPLATVDVEVALPPAAAKAQPNPDRTIYVSIKKNGDVYLMNDRTDVDSLPDDLKKLTAGRHDANTRIFIRADVDTDYGDIQEVLKKLQDSGFYQVALVGEDKALK